MKMINRLRQGYFSIFSKARGHKVDHEKWTSIVHIGAGKCGSSSLQAALSNRPTFSNASQDRKFKYISIQPKTTLNPTQIKLRIGDQPRNGIPSHSFDNIFFDVEKGTRTRKPERIREVRDYLSNLVKSEFTPIISNEALLHLSRKPIYNELFTELGMDSLVFLYIRPQVELINSAWWQWGVWGKMTFSQWYKGIQKTTHWNQYIRHIRDMDFVRELHVGICSNDVVSDFFRRIDVTIPNETALAHTNKSLGTEELSFLLRHRKYRPDPHTPNADAILERYPRSKYSQKAWCLNQNQVKMVLENHRNGNEELLELLPRNIADQISNDTKWWSAEAYSDRKRWNWTELKEDTRIIQQDAEMIRFLEANGL